jgi:SAM-dependent methyltransferase
MNQQQEIDRDNASFWDELCGTALAQSLGITEMNPESLDRFDQAYFGYYPYLSEYVLKEELNGKRVLEIGLGYGTLGALIARQGCDYFGLDIARGPSRMMQYRLDLLGLKDSIRTGQGSALALPFANGYFDYVYTIGCLHHTGNLPLSVQEVHRVIKPGGKAIAMLYNRHSFRQTVFVRLMRIRDSLRSRDKRDDLDMRVRALYDSVSTGEAAPFTEFVSRVEVKSLFRAFSHIHIDIQNFDDYIFAGGLISIQRKWFLSNLARLLGLDLYITVSK